MRAISTIVACFFFFHFTLGLVALLGSFMAPAGYEYHLVPLAFLVAGTVVGLLCGILTPSGSNIVLAALILVTSMAAFLLFDFSFIYGSYNLPILIVGLLFGIYFTIRAYKWAVSNIRIKWLME